MKIEVMSDVVVPLAVTGVSIATAAADAKSGKAGLKATRTMVAIAGVVGGYALQMMGKTERTAKLGNRLAVASFPAAGVAIYEWARSASAGTGPVTRSVAVQADPLLQYRKGAI